VSRPRPLPLGCASILILLTIFFGAEYASNLQTQRQTDALFLDLKGLKIGESTDKEVRRIVQRYGGEAGLTASGFCNPQDDDGHSVAISNGTLNWLGQRSPLLRPFGNRVWTASAVFLTSNGNVCGILYFVRAFRGDGMSEVAVDVNYLQAFSSLDFTGPPYLVDIYMRKGFLSFKTTLTTNASAEQRTHALDINLTCLSHAGGCRTGCEIMPSAWLDFQRQAQSQGWPLPAEEQGDSRCKKLVEIR